MMRVIELGPDKSAQASVLDLGWRRHRARI
jgi:hypothetical protein